MKYSFLFLVLILVNQTCNKRSASSNNSAKENNGFVNPLLPSGPDPWVLKKDSIYYYTHTKGDHIAIAATGRISDLKNAEMQTIWRPPLTGNYSREIWAPELHYFHNKWFLYFSADDGLNDHHRIYALECDDADPLKGNWIFKGKIADTINDKWAIDASVFEYKNQLFMVWSGWEGNLNKEQDIFIAKMKDPLTMESERILISAPTLDWEKMGAPPAVNEGPEAIINNDGELLITYSASGCWTDNYSLGLLRLKKGGDPMNASDWTKSPSPVFKTKIENGAYSPGHNGFFKSRDGKEDWIIYHANSLPGQGCSDARNPRMQQFYWNKDGSPDFGEPAKINQRMKAPGGE